ncbi:uncharacterized protein METZ01_LOCUS234564, partial [marine metagenome]
RHYFMTHMPTVLERPPVTLLSMYQIVSAPQVKFGCFLFGTL